MKLKIDYLKRLKKLKTVGKINQGTRNHKTLSRMKKEILLQMFHE